MAYLKHILFITLIFISTYAYAQRDKKYDKFVDSMSQAGQGEMLLPYFENELKTHPNDETVLRWLGYLNISRNNMLPGEAYYRRALKVNPKCAACYLNIARVYFAKQDNNATLLLIDSSLLYDNKESKAYIMKATVYESMTNTFDALINYNKAVEVDPNNFENYVYRGNYNKGQQYYGLAVVDFNKAIELTPDNYLPYLCLSETYYAKEQYKAALDYINKGLTIDSLRPELYNGRAAIYSKMNEHDKALADYTKEINLKPDDYNGYYARAYEKYELEDMDGFCQDIATAISLLKINGNNKVLLESLTQDYSDKCDSAQASYYYQHGVACYNLKQFEKAVSIYTQGLKKFPQQRLMTTDFRGNAYMALHDYKKALVDYDTALKYIGNLREECKNNPNLKNLKAGTVDDYIAGFTIGLKYSIAESKFYNGQYDEAMSEITTLIDQPQVSKEQHKELYYNLRGSMYMQRTDYDKAIADFNVSLILNPTQSIALVSRAIALANKGDKTKLTMASVFIGGSLNSTMQAKFWSKPIGLHLKKTDDNILQALADCDKAAIIEPDGFYIYYVRGQIRKAMGYADYCIDLLKAKQLGYPVEPELLVECR